MAIDSKLFDQIISGNGGSQPQQDMAGNAMTDIIRSAADRYGVDPDVMISLAKRESSLNPTAKNPNSSAGGLFQFIDGTWKDYGNGGDKFDPAANADAAARMLRDNLKRFGGNYDAALAAHHVGPGKALQALRDRSIGDRNVSTQDWLAKIKGERQLRDDIKDQQQDARFAEDRPDYNPGFGGDYRPSEGSRSGLELVTDSGAALLKGVGNFGESMGGLYGLLTGDTDPNMAQTGGKALSEFAESLKSDFIKNQERLSQQDIDAADGHLDKFVTAAGGVLKNPALFANFLLEQGINFVPGMAAGRLAKGMVAGLGGATAAAIEAAPTAQKAILMKRLATAGQVGTGVSVATGAVLQGADAGNSAYQQIMARPQAEWDADPEYQRLVTTLGVKGAKDKIALDESRAAFLKSAGVSALLNAASPAHSIDSLLVNGIKNRVLPESGRAVAQKLAERGAVRTMAGGAGKAFAGEALSEGADEGYGQYVANLAEVRINPNKDVLDQVAENAGLGAAFGPVGAVTGGIEGSQRRKLAQEALASAPVVDPLQQAAAQPNSPLSRAAVASGASAYPSDPNTYLENPRSDALAAAITRRDKLARTAQHLEGMLSRTPANHPDHAQFSARLAEVSKMRDELREKISQTLGSNGTGAQSRLAEIRGLLDSGKYDEHIRDLNLRQRAGQSANDMATRLADEESGDYHGDDAIQEQYAGLHELQALIDQEKQRQAADIKSTWMDQHIARTTQGPSANFGHMVEYERFLNQELEHISQLRAEALVTGDRKAAEQAQQAEQEVKALAQRVESGLADSDRRVADGNAQRSVQQRDAVLSHVLDVLPPGQNPNRAFDRALQAAGFTERNFSDAERAKIAQWQQLSDAFQAEQQQAEQEQAASAPNQMDAGAMGIKERRDLGQAGQAGSSLRKVDAMLDAGMQRRGDKMFDPRTGQSVKLSPAQIARAKHVEKTAERERVLPAYQAAVAQRIAELQQLVADPNHDEDKAVRLSRAIAGLNGMIAQLQGGASLDQAIAKVFGQVPADAVTALKNPQPRREDDDGAEPAAVEAPPAPRPPKGGSRLTPLDDPRIAKYADDLKAMAPESGWAEEGGKLLRDENDNVIGRTRWVPRAEWFLPGMLNHPKESVEAVRKAIAGEPMYKPEKLHVQGMMNFLDSVSERSEAAREVEDAFAAAISEDSDFGLPDYAFEKAAVIELEFAQGTLDVPEFLDAIGANDAEENDVADNAEGDGHAGSASGAAAQEGGGQGADAPAAGRAGPQSEGSVSDSGPQPQYSAGDRVVPERDVFDGDIVQYDGALWMAKVKRGDTIPLLPFVDGRPIVNSEVAIRASLIRDSSPVIHTGTNYYGHGGQPKPGADEFNLNGQTNEEAAAEHARQQAGDADQVSKDQADKERDAVPFTLSQQSQPKPQGTQVGLFTADGRPSVAAKQEDANHDDNVNPRYAAFKRLHPDGKNTDFMAFIAQMKREFAKSIGRRSDVPGGASIHDNEQDAFTAFIEKRVADSLSADTKPFDEKARDAEREKFKDALLADVRAGKVALVEGQQKLAEFDKQTKALREGTAQPKADAKKSIAELQDELEKTEPFTEQSESLTEQLQIAVTQDAQDAIDRGDMPVYKVTDHVSVALHPSAQNPGKIQVTRYTKDGIIGDSQYNNIADAVRQEGLTNKPRISSDAAVKLIEQSVQAEAEYQKRQEETRKNEPTDAEKAAVKSFLKIGQAVTQGGWIGVVRDKSIPHPRDGHQFDNPENGWYLAMHDTDGTKRRGSNKDRTTQGFFVRDGVLYEGDQWSGQPTRLEVFASLDDAIAGINAKRDQNRVKNEDDGAAKDSAESANPKQDEIKKDDGKTRSLEKTASWVVKDKATGAIQFETFDKAKVDALNTDKYVAVPILEHLQSLNKPADVTPADKGDIKQDAENKAPEVSTSMTDGTFKQWQRAVPSLGKVNGWTLFKDERFDEPRYVLMTPYNSVRFDAEQEARAWAKDNKAVNGDFNDKLRVEVRERLEAMTAQQVAATYKAMNLAGDKQGTWELGKALLAEDPQEVLDAMNGLSKEGGQAVKITADQAKKQMGWRNLGQTDGTKTQALFFYETADDYAARRNGMNYGSIESFQAGRWTFDGETFPDVTAAKKAVMASAMQRLANDGYVDGNATVAAEKPAKQKSDAHYHERLGDVSDFERFVLISADSIDKLRKIDVDRVLEQGAVKDFRQAFADWIKAKRPDLAGTVDEIMADLEPAQKSDDAEGLKRQRDNLFQAAENAAQKRLQDEIPNYDDRKSKAGVARYNQLRQDEQRKRQGQIDDIQQKIDKLTNAPAPTAAPASEMDDIKAQLGQAFDELASILGIKKNLTPEEESALLPVMAKIFRLAAKAGFIKFKEAARFVLDLLREHNPAVAEKLSIDNLQSGYINIAKEIGGDKRGALDVESIDDLYADEGLRERIEAAEQATNHDATPGQKEAGNYAKGKFPWNGLTISVETAKGEDRTDKETNGDKWRVTMPATYGYILRTEGADGDHVDAFMGPHPESEQVFIINQTKPGSEAFDEHKTMLGYTDAEAAKADYLASFSDGFGNKVFGSMQGPFSVAEFKQLLADGEMTKAAPIDADREVSARKALADITVTLDATEEETGRTVEIDEQADAALKDVDDRMNFARRLLECIAS